ncbi:EamA family transporter [Granulicella cerasi]|uniref:EamA family transporter n=2 Tax=Granulicella cerasi TaxID=741063 RepID=A0ABW1ZBZ0_9BACT
MAVALAAAISWGGGDFSGGMGTKASGGSTAAALRIIMLGSGMSFLFLCGMSLFTAAPMPSGAPLWWGLGAGVTAGIAVTAFYMALARGSMGPSAAVSGVLAAALPAVVSVFVDGKPGLVRVVGFLLAAAAIWMIAASGHKDSPGTMPFALLGGAGFGIYFVALRMANSLGIWEPMMLARVGSLITCGLIWLWVRRSQPEESALPPMSPEAWKWAALVALLDTGGNVSYTAATRLGRLDEAAVVASLYPAGTILLAAWKLHERPTRVQRIGMLVALAAVMLVSL